MSDQLDMFAKRQREGFGLSTAIISSCGVYRYQLHRLSEMPSTRLLWLMLNPSTADASSDDPTIRKCIGFTARFGFRSLSVGNLFAYRATDPDELKKAVSRSADIIGPDNNGHIAEMLEGASAVVLAWGGHGSKWVNRVNDVMELVRRSGKPTHVVGRCEDGTPRHPLMVGYESGLAHLRSENG